MELAAMMSPVIHSGFDQVTPLSNTHPSAWLDILAPPHQTGQFDRETGLLVVDDHVRLSEVALVASHTPLITWRATARAVSGSGYAIST